MCILFEKLPLKKKLNLLMPRGTSYKTIIFIILTVTVVTLRFEICIPCIFLVFLVFLIFHQTEKRSDLLKSGKSTSETTVRDINKKEAELDRYEITFGSPCWSERKFSDTQLT